MASPAQQFNVSRTEVETCQKEDVYPNALFFLMGMLLLLIVLGLVIFMVIGACLKFSGRSLKDNNNIIGTAECASNGLCESNGICDHGNAVAVRDVI